MNMQYLYKKGLLAERGIPKRETSLQTYEPPYLQPRKTDGHKLWQSRHGRHCPIPGHCGFQRNLLTYKERCQEEQKVQLVEPVIEKEVNVLKW